MLRYSILLGGCLFTWGLSQAALAGQAAYPSPCPCPTSTVCTPNVAGFGYFPTTWRQWPGEQRLEVINPRAVGLPVLPTPEGQEHIPAPTTAPRQPLPQGTENELIPPGGAILPPQESAPQSTPPAAPPEGSLPGLPVEPGPEVLPGLPEETKPTQEPKPSPSNQPGARRERYQRGTAAIPFESRKTEPTSTVVFLVDGKPTSGNPVQPTSYQAEVASTGQKSIDSQSGEAAAYASVESAATTQATGDANLGSLPVALGGYCPIDLILNGRWTPGDLRYTVVHDGAIYRLSGESQWRKFQESPADFVPAYSGNDPVEMIDSQNTVPGQVMYCAMYNGRLYMFSSPATQSRFNKNPQRYVVAK